MRQMLRLLGVGAVVVSSITARPGSLAATTAIAMVSGGGTADFVTTPNSVTTSGYTDFSIGVTVYSDGTAKGHFVCMVPAVVTISGDIVGGVRQADGSVKVYGLARGYDHFLKTTFVNMAFTATFREGKPAVGGVGYGDESGFSGSGQFDTEVVRRGMIKIVP